MTKNELLQRFQLNQLSESTHSYQHNGALKQAAVLIPLIDHQDHMEVLLTKRAKHLTHHAGQVSFPGGKVELSDKSLAATAIREANEEIALPLNAAKIIGQLHPYQTISGYIVTPIVAIVEPDIQYKADKNEVAEIFQVPLSHFLKASNRQTITVQQQGRSHQIHFVPYKNYNIWGATAAMINDLAEHIS
ncbi:MAG: CoA pyrophosphatase [Alteromonadaceae bacterium]|nr:CoA pyrophosphatase [Alteromonadaceae bacterium]